MKKYLLKLLGGVPKNVKTQLSIDFLKTLIKDNTNLLLKYKIRSLRVGDPVYITSGRRIYNPFDIYYLLESYNGGNAWYISKDINDPMRRDVQNGVCIDNISHTKPEVCPCCKQITNK